MDIRHGNIWQRNKQRKQNRNRDNHRRQNNRRAAEQQAKRLIYIAEAESNRLFLELERHESNPDTKDPDLRPRFNITKLCTMPYFVNDARGNAILPRGVTVKSATTDRLVLKADGVNANFRCPRPDDGITGVTDEILFVKTDGTWKVA